MPGSIIELFSPEVQSFYGAAAAGVGIIGLFIWSAGIRLARPAVAILVGLAATALAVWGLPAQTGIAPLTAGIIGFVAGVLAGAVTFRFVQALLLAACLAVVVSGAYYRSNILPSLHSAPRVEATTATLPAKDMLIATDRLEAAPEPATEPRLDAATVVETARTVGLQIRHAAVREWQGLTQSHQQRLGILGGLSALAGLLIALFFPRHTTWVCTAALGTLLLAAAGLALLQVYGTQYLHLVPTRPTPILAILGGILLVGLTLQRLLFWPGKKPKARRQDHSSPDSLPGEPVTA